MASFFSVTESYVHNVRCVRCLGWNCWLVQSLGSWVLNHGSTLCSLEHLSGVFLQPDLISFNSAIAATSISSSWLAASTLLRRAQQATCLCENFGPDHVERLVMPNAINAIFIRWAVVWVKWASLVGWVAAQNGIKPLQSLLEHVWEEIFNLSA